MTRPRYRAALAAAALLFAWSGAVPRAQLATQNVAPVPVPRPPGTAGEPISAVDTRFAIVAMQGDNAEIAEAKIAVTRSNVEQVLGYASKMIAEHDEIAATTGAALRAQFGTALPPALAPGDLLAITQLEAAGIVDFDQDYATDQIAGHLVSLTAYQTEAMHGKNPRLVALAKRWMPTIMAHLQLAVDLAKHTAGDSPFKQ